VYFDTKPCRVCGSDVELRPREGADEEASGPVGAADGVVGDADSTVDQRVCTNPDCPTREDGGREP
jgi:hypothetical protein